ncbi:Oligopeptide transport ATP-binding protein OppD [bioreactor metagenome]|uniref:Oligopeptide transport ATP-binding protein OppD n=1 Tax=bioreactor metagenome TaxID=1076179 RepID=A0A645ESW8_9ZZZZ
MNQRVGIALSMLSKPSIILADEPTSALDVTAQAQVVKTLMTLRDEFNTSIIIITHNMGVVSHMVDKVAVMYGGNIIEYGSKKDVIHRPLHPYTQMLIKSTPNMKKGGLYGIPGKSPIFGENKKGCAFASRCNKSIRKCLTETPSAVNYENSIVNCHLYKEVTQEEIII